MIKDTNVKKKAGKTGLRTGNKDTAPSPVVIIDPKDLPPTTMGEAIRDALGRKLNAIHAQSQATSSILQLVRLQFVMKHESMGSLLVQLVR